MKTMKSPSRSAFNLFSLFSIVSLVLAVFVTGEVTEGCAAYQKAAPYLPTLMDDACIATEVEKGITNPAVIIMDCPHLQQVAAADIAAAISGQALAAKAYQEAAMRHIVKDLCSDAGASDAKADAADTGPGK